MIYLLLSILLSTSLVVILKYFNKYNVHGVYGIVFNYLVCSITGFLFIQDTSSIQSLMHWPHLWKVVLMGFLFISVFLMIGRSTQYLGVSTTSLAFKLSFVIPVFMAIYLYQDKLEIHQYIGILLAIVAVIAISIQNKEAQNNEFPKWVILLPFLIFIGSGICDTVFNYIQKKLLLPGWEHLITVTVFFSAFVAGFFMSFYKKGFFDKRNILGGIVLGIPNYGSLYFLLLALQKTGMPSSKLFPINNLGIVICSAIIGKLLFKEDFSRNKIIGLLLAIVAIILLFL